MAKSNYKFLKERREKMISNCVTCNGSPEREKFELQGMKGEYCSNPNCMLVLNWERTDVPIKVKEKVIVLPTNTIIGTKSKFQEVEYTPGEQIDFSKLIQDDN